MMRPSTSSQQWYLEPGVINHWLCGVFEGGGAKGVAFPGALSAVRELGCWFGAVAGASAGAITAALVAAGLSPEEIEAQTDRALAQVRTGLWKGLNRLQGRGGYYPSDKLTDWLDTLLLERIGRAGSPDATKRVTFRELHWATGIELNLVAADLSLRRQIVFSHHETPDCSVADAVAASSAIPFAFPSRLLAVPEPRAAKGFVHHTIVDGGVWANFPMFVFEDKAFRAFYGREPAEIDPTRIVGFLLDEGEAPQVTRGADVRFATQRGDEHLFAREWLREEQPRSPERTPLGSHIAAWMLAPFAFLGWLVEFNGRVERGRWPEPRIPVLRNLIHGLNGLLSGIYPPLFGGVAVFAVGLGSWEIVTKLVGDQMRLWPRMNWSEPDEWMLPIFSSLIYIVVALVVTLSTFAALLGVIANRILLRATRRVLYGVASTYVAGQGAPEWAKLSPNIVALPIPPGVGTLTFDLTADVRSKMLDAAREITRTRVGALIGGASWSQAPRPARVG
jgi:predicted acylesterase/phospholipase RssA